MLSLAFTGCPNLRIGFFDGHPLAPSMLEHRTILRIRPTARWVFSHGRATAGVCLAWVLACASPTLPLPPPELPTVEAGADLDHVHLTADCGGVEANAVIVIINENPAIAGDLAVSGALASSCGKWDATVYAHKGDALNITQESGTDRSLPTELVIQ